MSTQPMSVDTGADEVGADAARAFGERHPGLRLAPVVVVIAALDEEACIGDVLDAIPAEACGLAVDTLVVDDGSRDATAEVARRHGAHVATRARNGGQGAAFRVGYRLAREHGARWIVTLDADGQWDPAGIAAVLEPVVAGEADLVLGSRVLGRTETDDAVRQAGVRVFAGLVRLLTGVRVTDTSSGLRAMTAELTAVVPLDQPQYQSSELLLGAIYHGYRVAERPTVMHKRAAGESKKGHNALYGLRYARVILRTWWRVRRATGHRGRVAAALEWIAPALPALRLLGFAAAVAIVVAMGIRAAGDAHLRDVTWWPLPLALAGAAAWWVLLARGWALLLGGHASRRDVSTWCRTQALRFLPGGVWAPAARATVGPSPARDRLSAVVGENLLALCAAVGLGGAALAISGRLWGLALVPALAVPAVAVRRLARHTGVTPARVRGALANYLLAFTLYAAAAVLVQLAVSGSVRPLAVAGAATVAWAAGLVVIVAPSGLGVRELAYVELLSDTLPASDLAAGAVTMRLAMIVAELAVLVIAGLPAWRGADGRRQDRR